MNPSLTIANRHIWFGHGSISQLIPLLTAEPQPTLLFSCRSFLNGAVFSSLADALTPLLLGTEIVSHEASPQEIDAWVARWRGKAQRVVAIGGGSVLDAAKAFAALVEHPLPTLRYMEKVGDTKISGATLPLIAIPTTAGTGSEVTQNAVITDTHFSKVKASLRHNNFVPHTAILDPQLLEGAPDKILAYCAIDAFTHLFEAYLSKTVAYMVELVFPSAQLGPLLTGMALPDLPNGDAVFLAAGVLGATIMPHVIYLHSSLTQAAGENSKADRYAATKFDVAIAMTIAGFVNLAMMATAAAAFHFNGDSGVTDLDQAYLTLQPLLGQAAATIFGLSLVAAGLSSTVVGGA
ncbi:Nramp family divalent metal transporter, partial [Serratia proteamaculans]